MPLTFLAHQGPFLPVVRRWSDRIDPVTFLVGTMAPDLAYVAGRSSWRVWAHDLPWVVTFNVPVTLAVAWVIVRVLAPVVPAHLPDLGGFHLRDYRAVAAHRFHVVRSPLWALLGALTHVGLDSFTHRWGWFARNWTWYRTPLVADRWLGKAWTPFEIGQYVGHVGCSVLFVVFAWRYGRARLLAGRAAEVPLATTSRSSQAVLWTAALVGLVTAFVFVRARPSNEADDIIRVAAGLFTGLTAGSLATRWVGPATNR